MSLHDPSALSPPGTDSDPYGFTVNRRIMLTAIIVIVFFVILMVSLHLYSRWYLLSSRRFIHYRNNRPAATLILFANPSSTTRGLDPSVIKSLPVFTFSAATASEAIECAVCLSEFKESESGRVLPECNHKFHVDCIDMWFLSHASCPLCRALVEPLAGDLKSTAEEVAITIAGPVSGDEDRGRNEVNDTDGVGEAGSSGHGNSRRKPAAIEVPRRNLGEPEFRSPMSRVMSFTRILSRERGIASSSSIELGEDETR